MTVLAMSLRVPVAVVAVTAAVLMPAPGQARFESRSDLRVQLVGVPDSITMGNEPATYELTVLNQGPQAARGVRAVVKLPTELRLDGSVPGGCRARRHTVSCSLGWIPSCRQPARTLSGPPPATNPCVQATGIALRATRVGKGRITASVDSRSRDLRPWNNLVGYDVSVRSGPPVAALSVAITADPGQVAVGSELHYRITVTNHGPDEAMRVTTRHQRPSTLEIRSIGGDGAGLDPGPEPTLSGCGGYSSPFAIPAVFCLPRLAAGASVRYLLTVLPDFGAVGTDTTSVDVSSSTPDPSVADNAGVTTSTVVPPPATADLGLTLAATPDPARIGQPVAFTATVTNHGPDTAQAVELHEEAMFDAGGRGPNGLQFVGVSTTQGSCDLRIVCALGRIDPGRSATVTLKMDSANATPGDYGLAATALSPTFDPSIFDTAAAPDGFAINASLVPG